MYSSFGCFARAYQVFGQLTIRNVVSWNTMVAACVHHGFNEEALNFLQYMRDEKLIPDRFTFACSLTACGNLKAAERGRDLHKEVVALAISEDDTVLGNTLVTMYAKCGALDEAQKVFDQLPLRNEVSWTALITGYCDHDYGKEALKCLTLMRHEGLVPDIVTFACALKACASIGSSESGEVAHASILKEGLLGKNSALGAALVDMYAKCDELPKAHFLIKEVGFCDTAAWNALVGGYCQKGEGQEALYCFEQMDSQGISPDAVTYTCILKACASSRSVEKGQAVHAEVVRRDISCVDSVLGNALVHMYAKCGALGNAQEVFDELSSRDVTSWTSLLTGYCEIGRGELALKLFEMMTQEGIQPDEVALCCILNSCNRTKAIGMGQQLHAEIIRRGVLGNLDVLGSALVNMYINCGTLYKAQLVFDEIPSPDSILWNVLISGYIEHGHAKGAIRCFEIMNCPPDVVTYTTVLKACGIVGAILKGNGIHSEIARTELWSKYIALGSALVDMYAKCSEAQKAQEVFNNLPARDIVTFTALITAYSEQGKNEMVFMCFNQMIYAGFSPDAVTFSCLMKACSNVGESLMGMSLFESMCTYYNIMPSVEHHTCMVGLLSWAGCSDQAMTLMEKIPYPHHSWFSLLSACHKLGNVNLARLAFGHV
ncbi:hypothetical protein KP509_30G024700 [Ceratopteris richardii]|nr:hypothetical protein KP509_30G024700 [Ceratopteris richardii]